MRVWLFRGLEEKDEDVAGERRPSRRLEVRGKALLAPENAHLMQKTKVSGVAKRPREKKKSNGELERPRIRGKQQRGEGKQGALEKEKAAAMRLE